MILDLLNISIHVILIFCLLKILDTQQMYANIDDEIVTDMKKNQEILNVQREADYINTKKYMSDEKNKNINRKN